MRGFIKRKEWRGHYRIRMSQYNVYYNEEKDIFGGIEDATTFTSRAKAIRVLKKLLEIEYGYVIERFYKAI